jgi:hypothetical protein
MLALFSLLLAGVARALEDGFEEKLEYKQFRLQLREIATPQTQKNNGTTFADIQWFK